MQPKLSYSQYGEDLIVLDFFQKEFKWDALTTEGKSFRSLEIGSIDGIKDSNTRLLLQHGWSGVFVEPHPYLFTKLHSNYRDSPNVQCVCALVGPEPELRTLHLNADGLATTHPGVFAGFAGRVGFDGHCFCASITPDMLSQLGPFDFVSIDAEGMDLSILRSGAKLLAETRLVSVEADLPGQPFSAEYDRELREACAALGFVKEIARTKGNLLIAKL